MQIHWVDGEVFGAAAKAHVEERLGALAARHDDLELTLQPARRPGAVRLARAQEHDRERPPETQPVRLRAMP